MQFSIIIAMIQLFRNSSPRTLIRFQSIRAVSLPNSALSQPANSSKFCVEQVRKHDWENYIAALLIHNVHLKRSVFALRAFNVELSLVRDLTTNSDRAKLRFHFWSKLVDEIHARSDKQNEDGGDKLAAYYNYSPIAKELLDLFHLIKIDAKFRMKLNDLIGARVSSKVLGYKPFENLNELELYCSKSNASLYHLAQAIGERVIRNTGQSYEEESLRITLENLGVAQGLTNILRGILYNASKNCCYVPKDLLDEYGLSNRDLNLKYFNGKSIGPVAKVLSDRSQELLNTVHSSHGKYPDYTRQLVLPRIAIQKYLDKLKKCDYNLSDSRLGRRNQLLPFNLWLASHFG